MPAPAFLSGRRRALQRVGGLCVLAAGLASRPGALFAAPAATRTRRIAQIVDVSADQQELSRDYGMGLQLALAESTRTSGRSLQLVRMEVDGSDTRVADALREIRKDDSFMAIVGTVGERVAITAAARSAELGLDIAHLGPWLPDTRFDADGSVFTIFASRDAQVAHALRSLAGVGVTALGVVHADRRSAALLGPAVDAAAARLGVRVATFVPPERVDLARFAGELPDTSPALLLFVGGAVELAQFTQGLTRRRLSRYVICLADIDITTLTQLGTASALPVIVTQVVPNPQTSPLAVVMDYRARLRELYDEAPSPVGLAGYLVGRCALQTLGGLDPAIGRAGVLAELRRHPPVDLGGYRVAFTRRQRGSDFVSQTLLRGNGRLIG